MTPARLSSQRAELDIKWGAASDVGKVRPLDEVAHQDVSAAFVVARDAIDAAAALSSIANAGASYGIDDVPR